MSHPIRRLSTLQSDVFLLNSHPGLFTVTHKGSACTTSPHGHPLSRSYGVILPSSLERVLSSALPFSGYLPVSGYGTISYETLLRVFLGSRASVTSPLTCRRLPVTSHPAFRRSYGFGRRHPTLRSPSLLRHLKMITLITGFGILTESPSPTPFGLDLGSTNPGWINLPQETLDFRCYGFSP